MDGSKFGIWELLDLIRDSMQDFGSVGLVPVSGMDESLKPKAVNPPCVVSFKLKPTGTGHAKTCRSAGGANAWSPWQKAEHGRAGLRRL